MTVHLAPEGLRLARQAADFIDLELANPLSIASVCAAVDCAYQSLYGELPSITTIRSPGCSMANLIRTLIPFFPITVMSALPIGFAMGSGMQKIDSYSIDRTEVSVEQFRQFVKDTGLVTKAERAGGGLVFGKGWERKAGWTWSSPFGSPADPGEPAVHITFDEAAAYCEWAGKRLPKDMEWEKAAYTETRANPPEPFINGTTYVYPTGSSPFGANCLNDCGSTPAIDYSNQLDRGIGHAAVGTTKAGVNGLYDMGANVWEWTENDGQQEKRTRGGSWWYGASKMKADDVATKPRDMAVVYIGFRCASDIE